MNTHLNDKRTRWIRLWKNLHSVRFEALPTAQEVQQILNGLPERKTSESIMDWLKRAPLQNPACVVLPFEKFRFTKLSEIYLKAAATGTEQYPIPEQAIETPDQCFRLTLKQMGDNLQVLIEALGIAIDDYKSQYIGIAASEDADCVVLVTRLDNNGESTVLLKDSECLRKVLCVHPVIGLIEPDSD